MKLMMILLFAGAMSASAMLTTTSGQWAEERMKAKTGRYSPAEEARREALAGNPDGHHQTCKEHNCCRHQHASAKPRRSSKSADILLASKFGRGTTAGTELRAHGKTFAAGNATSYSNAWWRSKLGRSMPHANAKTQTARLVVSGRSEASGCDPVTCCD
jgi:hypothetical protein